MLVSPFMFCPRKPIACSAFLVVLTAATACGMVGCQRGSSGPAERISLDDLRHGGADSTRAPTYDPSVRDGTDVPYVTTSTALIDSMLVLAGVTSQDVVYDLGSGDGRIPIRAATTYGARGVGIEIRADLVERARHNAREAGVADRVAFRQGDLFEADIRGATVVTLFLLPDVNRALRPKLLHELRPGARVVSRNFHMGNWEPDRTDTVGTVPLYVWTIPAQAPDSASD